MIYFILKKEKHTILSLIVSHDPFVKSSLICPPYVDPLLIGLLFIDEIMNASTSAMSFCLTENTRKIGVKTIEKILHFILFKRKLNNVR